MKEKFDRNMPHKSIGEIEVKPSVTAAATLCKLIAYLERKSEELGPYAKIASIDEYVDIDKAPEERQKRR